MYVRIHIIRQYNYIATHYIPTVLMLQMGSEIVAIYVYVKNTYVITFYDNMHMYYNNIPTVMML